MFQFVLVGGTQSRYQSVDERRSRLRVKQSRLGKEEPGLTRSTRRAAPSLLASLPIDVI